MRLVQKQRRLPERKQQIYRKAVEGFKNYRTVLIVDVEGLSATTVRKAKFILKSLLGEHVEISSLKISVARKALKDARLPHVEELERLLTGQRIFIFSDLDPFTLASIVSAVKIPSPAKPGMVVDREVVIPAGNTGIPPGPMLSVFGRLRIQTKVQGGTIWIAKDAKVAKPGDVLSPELASLLQKLGINPVEKGLKVLAAYHEGTVIPADKLKLNLDEYLSMLQRASVEAMAVGVESAAPIPGVIEKAVSLAYLRAVSVAAEAGLALPETAERVVQAAVRKALAVVAALGERARDLGLEAFAAAVAAPQPAAQPAEKPKEEAEAEEEKKEISEEDLAAGLGSLFG